MTKDNEFSRRAFLAVAAGTMTGVGLPAMFAVISEAGQKNPSEAPRKDGKTFMDKDTLNILWTNADPMTAEMMVLMYAKASAAQGWWKRVRIIIWGATAKLVAENPKIRELVREAREEGVEFSACEACADKLGVKKALLDQGIEVILWGVPLTDLIRNGENLITI